MFLNTKEDSKFILINSFQDNLQSMFKSLNGEKKVNIVELMFKKVEQVTNNLEELVQEKTLRLEEEKQKIERLLSEMLPK